ncbi:mannan endo-1,6-alpha-mannosidase DCW1 [Verticillium alfalfae VaMs.102]|uniref:Mannan endo-1,6-alpha-mannosidase n=1 Tax=Verticillium alfalfae (strain VaMs.102 / ATCC MYA-4576 / FGSC 10136) TaxID=526221 RepID=C9SWW3_VERA1|nr:mannan endo-1,6-alpha-mannosidase DCW1 [Verticillium alfalfae VaMs.102]EEY23504.1 mannan endo-1,6-alpha-mannosidase DCW1 [Verticillium alfalfae VaMs.102]
MFNSLHTVAPAALLALSALPSALAQGYSIDSDDAIRETARTLAYDMMLFYEGNKTGMIPGILPGPPADGKGDYYWWQGGAMMGTYVDYWHLTGDTSYNDVVREGMVHQVGDNRDYMPLNHTASLGNDDQGFWGMTAMLAAENKFPDPPEDQPQWLALAQAVWSTQNDRFDDHCNGGLRWQAVSTNAGYNYKNTIANGCFFNIGARLARYTRNDTYTKAAEETWDWLWGVNYIDHENWRVYDGGHIEHNCTDINKGHLLLQHCRADAGAAFMYNYTETPSGSTVSRSCWTAALPISSREGYMHRWLAVVTQLVPGTASKILPVLQNSTQAAIRQCTGGASGRVCGFYWDRGEFIDPAVDKTTGAGEQMNVLAAVSSLLIAGANPPTTNDTGGTSRGDSNAGRDSNPFQDPEPITTADRAGAGIVTFIILASGLSSWYWMSFWD